MKTLDVINSKVVRDFFDQGKLPAVTIDTTSIAMLSGSLLMVAIITIFVYRLTK